MTRHDADRKVKILDYIAATLRARGYPAVGPRDRAGGRARLDVRRPPPPADPRARGLSRARRRAVARHPADADRGDPARPDRASSSRSRSTAEAHVLPVIGEIAAGGPIEAYQDASETMAVPDMLAPSGDAYVLKVRGDSMIEAHIADGDFVADPAADHRPQRRHRGRPGRGERGHPQALLQGEGPRPPPAGEPELPAAVLRRRADPGQAHRRHPPPRLRAAAVLGPAGVGRLRASLTHLECARSRARRRLGLDRRRRQAECRSPSRVRAPVRRHHAVHER